MVIRHCRYAFAQGEQHVSQIHRSAASRRGLCESAETYSDCYVPDKLKPRANESLAMVVPAKGVQIYECRAKRIKPIFMNGHSLLPEGWLFPHKRKEHRQTLRGSALGIDRWQ